MISDARRGHVSPGIYTEEKEVLYSVKSLGVTSLGLVGETLYGPAFQNVEITSWSEFVDYFGGTSPEKFVDGGYPKYELPYIAKSYLEASQRLNVVRVLGLSGYNAGKAWVISADGKPAVILRSKMSDGESTNMCEPNPEDIPTPKVNTIELLSYSGIQYTSKCEVSAITSDHVTTNYKFALKVTENNNSSSTTIYNVSLNPADSDYIYNVISSRPDKGESLIYVESIFESSFDILNSGTTYTMVNSGGTVYENPSVKYSVYEDETKVEEFDKESDAKEYITKEQAKDEKSGITFTTKPEEYGSGDLQNYKSEYRAAQTPWIVSDAIIKVATNSATTADVRKLFKFVTISDGDAANFQVKVSIENIDVKKGTFDVIVRDYYDSDANPLVLESFRRCNLIEGDVDYIAYKIGTIDGGYEAKSKYILVEMAENTDFGKSFPAGFMGYPMPKYDCKSAFTMSYNTTYDPSKKAKKQYFGISDLAGIDNDVFTFKGVDFNEETKSLTSGFHMDSAMPTNKENIYVDGVTGYNFTAVNNSKVTNTNFTPRLINAPYIDETLYADMKTRKFTVCFFGGFDGWDVNRGRRTNTDEYKSTKYNVGENEYVFKRYSHDNNTNLPLNLPATAITSDYYAYLAGCRVFANPQDIDINILATPGINWLDNALLTDEIIDMVEDAEDGRNGDTLYIMTAPNYDANGEALDAEGVAREFEGRGLESSYACTYFPWVMFYDSSNRRYIELPVTKDVVKNMAVVDNTSFPWFAPAGTERGKVNCIKATYKTTLADEDMLYNSNINPVKSFAQDGVIIWGNKTAYSVDSPLNRINVRRMMIRLKKLINDAAKHLIFEQYDETLEQQFRGIVDPILSDIKANRGIIDYRVMTECTPETRDQHILPAKILVKPTQALEYISISFVVYPESVKFEE